MNRLSREQFEVLIKGATTLSADEHGLKVLECPEGRVIKLFRRKRWLSSALLRPYAHRFAKASAELARRGVRAAVVEQVWRVPSIQRDVVVYRHVPGESLREKIADNPDERERLIMALAVLLADLHRRGIYFRAAHFGNFIVSECSREAISLSLIDLSETRFRAGTLPTSLRARNFRPPTRYSEDRAAIAETGVKQFVQAYLDAADLEQREQARFLAHLRGVHAVFAEC